MKLTLMHKGLLLVSIPLCFEIAMFSVLINMQEQVERDAQILEHKRQINECMNTIINDMARIALVKKRFQQGPSSTENLLRKNVDELLQAFAKVEELTKDEPELLQSVQTSKKAVLNAKEELTLVRSQVRNASSIEEVNGFLIASRKRLDADLAVALNSGILDIVNKTEQGEDLEKNIEARHRITLLLRCALWISAILGISLAVVYSRNLTLRIMRVKENATRFANRESLRTVLTGNDEIAELDRAFHDATRQIETATRKERAILENATDLIFSLNEDLVITSANPSTELTIGTRPEDLIGETITSLIAPEEAEKLSQSLLQMIATTHKAELEVHMLRKNMSAAHADPLNVVVSASYSPRDKSFYCIVHDVTSQRQMERMRQEVVAMITHDLRTPLQTIRNYLEMLRLGMLGNLNDQGDSLLTIADKESRRMSTLIDGVLTLEKLRSGNTELNLENLDLFKLLDSCAKALELVSRDRQIEIEIEPFTPIEIRGDRLWLEQILLNVLTNALKFSPPKTRVTMSAKTIEDNAEIRIKDQGPGIPKEDQQRIFERFQRVSATAHKVGSGLGLNICKELLQLHKGSIRCESEQDQGSTFIILLPLAVKVAEV
ncbi:MAG: PAS domain S-box protein [Cyanobacteria bacterium SZAS LIN-5]|nr:PAS domain S-box protein [Cyanobacteria bacterium SZAS LIN-5]